MKQEMFIYLAWKPWYQHKHIREIEGQQKDNKLQRHFTSPYKKCRWSCARKNSFWQDVYGFCVSFPNLWTKTLWIRKSLAATSTMNAAGFPYVFMTKTFMSNVRTFPEDCLAIPPKKAENVFWCAAILVQSVHTKHKNMMISEKGLHSKHQNRTSKSTFIAITSPLFGERFHFLP